MRLFKKLPFSWKGELHDVRLVNFSVPGEEVRTHVPANIKIRLINGRAMISMVDVKLKNLRLAGMPSFCSFSYRHLAFRLLVDDRALNNGNCKGIYFLKSFCDKPLIAYGGGIFTDYRLGKALIFERSGLLTIDQGAKHLRYHPGGPCEANLDLQGTIGMLDRAYSGDGENILVTQIMREKWPLQSFTCKDFYTNFFRDARLEGTFRVPEVIYYTWLPPKMIEQ